MDGFGDTYSCSDGSPSSYADIPHRKTLGKSGCQHPDAACNILSGCAHIAAAGNLTGSLVLSCSHVRRSSDSSLMLNFECPLLGGLAPRARIKYIIDGVPMVSWQATEAFCSDCRMSLLLLSVF